MDVKQFSRFSSPGHAVTGDRSRSGARRRERVGYELPTRCSTTTRASPIPLHQDERAATVGASSSGRSRSSKPMASSPRRLQTDNAWPTPRTGPSRTCSQPVGSSTVASRPAHRSATARSSATSRRSNASGGSASVTAHPPTVPELCHTGCATTTSGDATQRSATAHRSAAFGTFRGRTSRGAATGARPVARAPARRAPRSPRAGSRGATPTRS